MHSEEIKRNRNKRSLEREEGSQNWPIIKRRDGNGIGQKDQIKEENGIGIGQG